MRETYCRSMCAVPSDSCHSMCPLSDSESASAGKIPSTSFAGAPAFFFSDHTPPPPQRHSFLVPSLGQRSICLYLETWNIQFHLQILVGSYQVVQVTRKPQGANYGCADLKISLTNEQKPEKLIPLFDSAHNTSCHKVFHLHCSYLAVVPQSFCFCSVPEDIFPHHPPEGEPQGLTVSQLLPVIQPSVLLQLLLWVFLISPSNGGSELCIFLYISCYLNDNGLVEKHQSITFKMV